MGFIEGFVRLLAVRAATTTTAAPASTKTLSSVSSTTVHSSTSTHATTTSSASIISRAPVYNMTVQTVFTPPSSCAKHITAMAISSGDLWNNAIVPASGVIESACYPSQFWSSAIATTSLPPFKQLVCPQGWGTNQINSTYVVCCPNGYGLYAPNITNTIRPATWALCTSWIWPNALYDVTSWDTASVNTTIAATANANGTIVFATPFDGIAASTTLTSALSSSVSITSSSVKITSTSSSTKTGAGSTSSSVSLSTLSP